MAAGDSPLLDNFTVDNHLLEDTMAAGDSPLLDNFTVDNHLRLLNLSGASSPVQTSPSVKDLPVNQRQKSLDVMDQSAMSAARLVRSPGNGAGGSLRLKERSMSMPTRPASQATTVSIKSEAGDVDSAFGSNTDTQQLSSPQPSSVQERASVSNDNNILLDPDVLSDHVTQVLVLTVLATLVKYTTDENEVRILYEYLAEASVVFPKVFPVIHSLLDAKITNVLSLCHDKTILASVQSIIENMISCEDTSQQQLHFLQSC